MGSVGKKPRTRTSTKRSQSSEDQIFRKIGRFNRRRTREGGGRGSTRMEVPKGLDSFFAGRSERGRIEDLRGLSNITQTKSRDSRFLEFFLQFIFIEGKGGGS